MNTALDGGGWSPERELLEAAPRRYAPSPWPDYNQPNAPFFFGAGGLLLVAGLTLFFVAFTHGVLKKNAGYIGGGAVMSLVGAVVVSAFPVRRKQYLDRAANLVENGAPVIARIVNVQNSTGDSQYGRLVTYMVTMPGDIEETRKEVQVDDRALPKTLPGPATALIDFKTNDIALYCSLPFIAVSKFATAAARQSSNDLTAQTGIPTLQQPLSAVPGARVPSGQAPTQMPGIAMSSPSEPGAMPGLGQMAPPPAAPVAPPSEEPKQPKPAPKPSVAKLPWEQ